MDDASLFDQLISRIGPDPAPDPGWWILLALAAGVLAVVVPGVWGWTRRAVTVVHELGHALVGIAAGRRFTGFVINGDMSGHAVTVGRARGIGRAASTWAGYPAPGILGAALVAAAMSTWSRPALSLSLAVLILSLVFVRSMHTLATVLIGVGLLGALWWWGSTSLIAGASLAAGAFLLLGAWRHLATVIRHGGRTDDPGQLAAITGAPAWMWSASYVLVLAGAMWWAGISLSGAVAELPGTMGA